MFELLSMLFLSGAYALARIGEAKEEKLEDLKIKVCRYAILNRISYNEVVKSIQDKKLTFEQIDEFLERKSNE